MKKIYYKVVCDDYPKGLFFEDNSEALELSKKLRENGEECYVRKVKPEEDFVRSLPEI